MKTYLITGGAGFIGSHIAKRLTKSGNSVIIFDDLSTGYKQNIPESSIFYKVDISDEKQLNDLNLTSTIDTVYHCAAQSSGEASFDNPIRDIEVNYKATYNILKFSKEKKVKRFIYTSSMSVYGESGSDNHIISESYHKKPLSYYGCNKLASEKIIDVFSKNSDLVPTIFRLFNVYGPGQNMHNRKQGMVSIYLSYIMKNEPILVKGSLERFRDFTYIDDVVDALTQSEESCSTFHEVFNLGTGIKTTVNKLLKEILNVYEKSDFKEWVKVDGYTSGDINGCIADNRKLRKAIEWNPTYSLSQGINNMKIWIDKTIHLWLESEIH